MEAQLRFSQPLAGQALPQAARCWAQVAAAQKPAPLLSFGLSL
jgi:hypothetical protein